MENDTVDDKYEYIEGWLQPNFFSLLLSCPQFAHNMKFCWYSGME